MDLSTVKYKLEGGGLFLEKYLLLLQGLWPRCAYWLALQLQVKRLLRTLNDFHQSFQLTFVNKEGHLIGSRTWHRATVNTIIAGTGRD